MYISVPMVSADAPKLMEHMLVWIGTGVFKKKRAPCPWEFSKSLYIFTSSSYVFIYAFCIFCIVLVCIFDIR